MITYIKKAMNKVSRNLAIVLFILIWELAVRTGLMNQNFVAAPSAVVKTVIELYQQDMLFNNILISLQRALLGFLFAALVGIPLGFLLGGWFKNFERVVFPVLRLLGQFNAFSLFPVFMALFGINELQKVIVIFWVSLWPVTFNTITGFKEVEPLLVKATKSMGASKVVLFRKVYLPSAMPYIFTGLKMASGTAFFMLIAAEMIGASKGLGWLVINAQVNYMIPRLYSATILISVLGLILNKSLSITERRVINWRGTAVN